MQAPPAASAAAASAAAILSLSLQFLISVRASRRHEAASESGVSGPGGAAGAYMGVGQDGISVGL